MTNLENLAYTKFTTDDSFTTHNVAILAYHDGLASDYYPCLLYTSDAADE